MTYKHDLYNQTITVVHSNCYGAKIDGKYVRRLFEDDYIIILDIDINATYEVEYGTPRWDSITVLDKDEITSIYIGTCGGNIIMPMKNISNRGSYFINEKSSIEETENSIIITWVK